MKTTGEESRSPAIDSRLQDILESYLERCRRGESPLISEYTEEYPDLAETIREYLFAASLVEGCRTTSFDRQESCGDSMSSNATGKLPSRLGSYRIVREIGRGALSEHTEQVFFFLRVAQPPGEHQAIGQVIIRLAEYGMDPEDES